MSFANMFEPICGRIRGSNERCWRPSNHEGECVFREDSNVVNGRCTHPNAYPIGGRALMHCPSCGTFSAMEE